MADCWFSLVYGGGRAHHIIYQRVRPEKKFFQKMFNSEDFFMYHVWYGMFVREHCHAFSRKAKATGAFSVICVGSFICMMLIGTDLVSPDEPLDVGHYDGAWSVKVGFLALLASICINYPLIYLHRNCNPDRKFVYYFSDFSGIDPTGPRPLYKYPWFAKVCVTLIQASIMLVTFMLQIMYGLEYGTRKAYMWLTAVVIVFLLDFLIAETLNVLTRAFIYRIVMKYPDLQRFCNDSVLMYVLDQVPYANRVNKKKFLKRDMLQPMSKKVKYVLWRKEQNFRSLRQSILDFAFFLVLFLVNCQLYSYYYTSDSYYSTLVIERMFIRDLYSRTPGFMEITTYDELFLYMNSSMLFNAQWQEPNWGVISNVKLIGVMRLRQHRVKPRFGFCVPPVDFDARVINRCEDDEVEWKDMDTHDYNPQWKAYNASSVWHSKWEYLPFMYVKAEESETKAKEHNYQLLPGDGYIANLGRKGINTRLVLNYLVKQHWFANKTRYIFIDGVFYNAHSNFFNVLTMIVGISRTGDITKGYTINTFRALVTSKFLIAYQVFLYIFLAVQSFNIVMRHVHQIKYCLFRLQAFQDTLVMTLTVSTLLIYAFRFIAVLERLDKIHVRKLNVFTSMDKIIELEYWSKLTTGLLCSQNLVHLIDVGHTNRHIRIFYYMFVYAMQYIVICIVFTCIFLVSFSTAFHFIIGQDNFLYHSHLLAYVQTFNLPFASEPTITFQYGTIPTLIPYIMFTFYGYTFRFLISSMFAVVLVNSYHRARMRLQKDFFLFSIPAFFKERVLGGKIKLDADRQIALTYEQIMAKRFKK